MSELKKYLKEDYIKNLNSENIDFVAEKIRSFLIDNVLETGGHLASNLGVVELILALHKSFDFNNDKIVFDVGHQCYVHKMITGRLDDFFKLRKKAGLSGFPKTQESKYDFFNTGHSSTSISAALGMARARDLAGENYHVIAFIGDGSLSSGMSFEALNDLGATDTNVIIILNDNEMSINENVGGLSVHLNKLRLRNGYLHTKDAVHKFLDKTGKAGNVATKILRKAKNAIKYLTVKKPMFEDFGVTYIGIINGYNFDDLTEAFEMAKNASGPVLIHTLTKKGKGYYEAESNPSKFHGVSSKNIKHTNASETYTEVFGKYLVNKAEENSKIVSVTAAMSSGCGLTDFQQKYPERFFDVGIAEEHAVTMAAGLAISGYTPVFSVYSTFLQRGYDQILHDVCMQNLHVVFAIDRAGIVGEDGETHQGIFDFSYLLHIPNITILAPSCKEEFVQMLECSIDNISGPVAVRYPKDYASSREGCNFVYSDFEKIMAGGTDIIIFSIGRMLELSCQTADILKSQGYGVSLMNVGTVIPINTELLNNIVENSSISITIEDNVVSGGAGEYMLSLLKRKNKSKMINFGFGNTFVEQGTQNELFEQYGFTPENLVNLIKKELSDNE